MGLGTKEQIDEMWEDARRLYYEGDHRGAFERYLALADRGVPEVQVSLGYLYFSGEGTKRDIAKAEHWLTQAANRGDYQAQWYLSQVFLQKKQFKDAQRTLEELESIEDLDREWRLRVLWELAIFHMKQKNDKQALRYLKEVEDEDGELAHWYAGIILERAGDFSGSFQSFEKSANLGYSPAIYRIGVFYRAGKGVKRDSDKAMALFEKAARKGNARAEAAYARMLIGGKKGLWGIPRGLLILLRNPFKTARIAWHDTDDIGLRG